jgi:hypothetical protein
MTLAGVCALFPLAAQATVIEVIYEGEILSGQDDTGEFGTPGDLAGLSVVVRMLYDLDRGLRSVNPGQFDQVVGGGAYEGAGPPLEVSPSLGATVTVGGVGKGIVGGYYSDASILDLGYAAVDEYLHTVQDYYLDVLGNSNSAYVQAYFYEAFDAFPEDLETPFSWDISGPNQYGYFQFVRYDAAAAAYFDYAYASFRLDRFTVSALTAVPLPAGAGLLAAGLLALGWVRRRRGVSHGGTLS